MPSTILIQLSVNIEMNLPNTKNILTRNHLIGARFRENLLHQFPPRLRHVSRPANSISPTAVHHSVSVHQESSHPGSLSVAHQGWVLQRGITTWVFCRLSQLLKGKLELQSSLLCNDQLFLDALLSLELLMMLTDNFSP